MPPWVSDLGRLLIGISALILSLGFATAIWKVAWAMRGYVEAERARHEMNEKLVVLVQEFIAVQRDANEIQRDMNKSFENSIKLHGMRIERIEEKLEER